MADYLIGIDGGGTSCRAAVADAAGRILGRGKCGASNILTDPDTALKNIEQATRLAFAEAGLDENLVSSSSALLGVAGNNVAHAVDYISARLPFRRFKIVSDGLIALQGAIGNRDGAIAILGTGSIFIARHSGTVHYVGGWGFQIGDFGSGARIGHAALQESLLAHDGIRPQSEMTRTFMAEFDDDPSKAVDFARAAFPNDYGRYAPRVLAFAEQGDAAALRLMAEAASLVDEALDRVSAVNGGEGPLCLLGGLAEIYPRFLAERHRARLSKPAGDALTGAVSLAAATFQPARQDVGAS
ncbi:N-acetylglucosamine kinase [Corticibacterium sp. UT-5YL-CI-8]|nr:N-acetylglucosamine kinase [Tianweitania sp. UT-5YL-CI-8]